MTDFFDELEAQLRHAARDRLARRRAPRRRWLRPLRRTSGTVAIVAAVAVAVAVAVVALTTIGHHKNGQGSLQPSTPGPTGAVLRQEANYIRAANLTARRSGACREDRQQLPAVSDGSPSHALLSDLGVLRRPAVAADRLPRSVNLGGSVSEVYIRYVRLARVTDGVSYYIVPAAHALVSPGPTSSLRCRAAILAALRAELPRIPRGLRPSTLALATRLLANAGARAQLAREGGICLMSVSAQGQGGTCGSTASELKQNGMLSAFGPLSGVVPDGVASVTINYPSGNGQRAQTATTNVAGNVFASSINPGANHSATPTIIWRSATGRTLKTVVETPRNRGGDAGFCQGKPSSNFC
jgi:hypothetical protein